jgi:hypothetical protein
MLVFNGHTGLANWPQIHFAVVQFYGNISSSVVIVSNTFESFSPLCP